MHIQGQVVFLTFCRAKHVGNKNHHYFAPSEFFPPESRLRKLKSDPNVLRQLTEKREACMRQLLGEQTFSEPEALTLEQPVDDSPLLRAVAPHRQALTQGETVELVKHDHLATEE